MQQPVAEHGKQAAQAILQMLPCPNWRNGGILWLLSLHARLHAGAVAAVHAFSSQQEL